jgi:hypothetical protein
MSFIEEHFDAEVAIVSTVAAAFWGLLRINDSQEKQHLRQWLGRIEAELDGVSKELKVISSTMVNGGAIKRIDDDISDVQKQINLTREKLISIERIKEIEAGHDSLRSMIQKTREQMLQVATKENSDASKINESIARIEKELEKKADKNNCQIMHQLKREDK